MNINSDFLFNDLIKNEKPLLSDIEDTKFLENYFRLNDYNKIIANSIINELVKIQNDPKYLENAGKRMFILSAFLWFYIV